MKLSDILCDCDYELAAGSGSVTAGSPSSGGGRLPDVEIGEIAYDSRKVSGGALFVAVRGDRFDGRNFISDAIAKGAVAVVHEKTGLLTDPPAPTSFQGANGSSPVFIRVDDSRKALACVSNNFFERPSEEVPVIGVTGTNGKTTTTYLIKAILEAWDKATGLIGTIRYLVKEAECAAPHTTPESLEFQGLLRKMVSAGCAYVITEVSSHSLSQQRVDYTRFQSAVFTNLTRDHLDFHGTMERYYDAKKRLFTELLPESGTAVINLDDPWGKRLLSEIKRTAVTYGVIPEADITAEEVEYTFSGVSFLLRQRGAGSVRIDSPMIGSANLYNILAAAAAAMALGVPMEVIGKGLRTVPPVEGRLEKVDEGQGFLCIVDYAHTPDALEQLISAVREIIAGEGDVSIITVFGCGGDRDRGKRPVMGEIATRLSDHVFITSDNPRNEDPIGIIKEIESGIEKANYRVVPERAEAIALAVEKAGDGDILIIAGKGHENYQEVGERRYPFSDREVAQEAIRRKKQKIVGNT
ncbi:MAG TPA: UDP-N-acetylmuramoyl-L-alanyl-D-glutamate--2,6-diaminopimelate ligase [Thermodesulfovibrionales bacterium]|nr:UDP-N-acetylmuramoyl-L-alanyl-D-glutamate--2,6-diaminopimelate ligase [Thermodesulfovibrionales bacterium]